jgi:glycosyltransferase involved in cell wall biosynthesis
LRTLAVAFDMTFANRNQGGSGVYARSVLGAVQARNDIVPWVIQGPRRSTFVGTMRWLVSGARKATEAHPPDVLHCPTFVAPWAVKAPMVITVYDAAASRYPHDHPLEWSVYVRSLMPGRLKAAARIITLSEFARGEVAEMYGVDRDKVVAIHGGLDSRFFSYIGEASSDDAGVIVFPGAPIGRKNLDIVLQCMAAAATGTSLAKATLEISGAREEDFPAYARKVRALNLQARVRWLGNLPFADMPALYGRASAVVYPSVYEGFGFPPLEAMAVGTPVVASNRGSLPEVLGDAALLIDPTDPAALTAALEAVLTKPELSRELSDKGTQRARLYTWEKCAARTVEVYRDVLNRAAAHAS